MCCVKQPILLCLFFPQVCQHLAADMNESCMRNMWLEGSRTNPESEQITEADSVEIKRLQSHKKCTHQRNKHTKVLFHSIHAPLFAAQVFEEWEKNE